MGTAVKLTLECLICGGKLTVEGKGEEVDDLVKVWDAQHEPCRAVPT